MAAGKDEAKKEKATEKKTAKATAKRKKRGEAEPITPELEEKPESNDKAPFELSGIDIVVPRGALVCVVGSVGSGKVRSRQHP